MNSLEIRGALTARLSHDLTNQLAVIAGHLLLMELSPEDVECRRNSMLKMREASEASAALIAQINHFQKPFEPHATERSSEYLVAMIRETPLLDGWKLRHDWLSPAPLAIQGRWVIGAIEYLADMVSPARGTMILTSNHNKPEGGWSLEVQWTSAKPWLAANETRKPKQFDKALVLELLEMAGCSARYSFSPPELNTLQVHFPPL